MTLEEKQIRLGNAMTPIPRLKVNKYDVLYADQRNR